MTRARRRSVWLAASAVALVTAAVAGGCDLNPQPIPPGDQPDGSTTFSPAPPNGTGGSDTNATDAAASDGGSPRNDHDGAVDGGETGVVGDGGDAGDAADAALDADAAD